MTFLITRQERVFLRFPRNVLDQNPLSTAHTAILRVLDKGMDNYIALQETEKFTVPVVDSDRIAFKFLITAPLTVPVVVGRHHSIPLYGGGGGLLYSALRPPMKTP